VATYLDDLRIAVKR